MARAIFPPERPAAAPAKRLALKVDVQTYRGTLEGVPSLIEVLRRHGAQATFLFALGTEHTGARLLRMGSAALRRVGNRPLLPHYGATTDGLSGTADFALVDMNGNVLFSGSFNVVLRRVAVQQVGDPF